MSNEIKKNDVINISIPKELYKEFENLCKITNVDIQEKLIEILRNTIDSIHIDNF